MYSKKNRLDLAKHTILCRAEKNNFWIEAASFIGAGTVHTGIPMIFMFLLSGWLLHRKEIYTGYNCHHDDFLLLMNWEFLPKYMQFFCTIYNGL